MSWILHASDLHLGRGGAELLDDDKEDFTQSDLETTQRVFERTLGGLSHYVRDHGRPAAAVFSGDLAVRADSSGFTAFEQLLDSHRELLPEQHENIVVVPGNHDVVWEHDPGSRERYAGFLSATRDRNCSTPLLDGIDFDAHTGDLDSGYRDAPHLVSLDEVLIVPINSSNWCGTIVTPRGALPHAEASALVPTGIDDDERTAILGKLDRLYRRDMARVSRWQIEALDELFEADGVPRSPADDPRVRIAVLHHQLLPLSTREERKAFESLVNLGLVRRVLYELGIHIVLHGHKHESGVYWDLLGDPQADLNAPGRRALVISAPGRFNVDEPVMRAIHLEGPLHAPNASVVTFRGRPSAMRNTRHDGGRRVPLWTSDLDRREQASIVAATASEAYARLRSLYALRDSNELRNVVCQIDDGSDADRLPPDYPSLDVDDRDGWLKDLVDWWQSEHSELVARQLLTFNHGQRIRRRWGDQVERAGRILNERSQSSRALIVLVAPRETGRYAEDDRSLNRGSFPAFVLAEFSLGERDGATYLDAFSYFRKQEMQFWWPVNLAELRGLQEAVCREIEPRPRLGRLVTFSAVALWRETLPRVAVPLIDLFVESRPRLLDMALALAYPTQAEDACVRDWRDVLRDLAGLGRDAPPKVAAGVGLLLGDLRRLGGLPGAADVDPVVVVLEALEGAYEPHVDAEDLPPAAQRAVGRQVDRLSDAVTALLPEAAP